MRLERRVALRVGPSYRVKLVEAGIVLAFIVDLLWAFAPGYLGTWHLLGLGSRGA